MSHTSESALRSALSAGQKTLLDLAARCEAAKVDTDTGFLDTLARDIHNALPDGVRPVNGSVHAYPRSLDAAMELVPEWAKLHFLQDTEYDNPAEKTWSANLRARSWKETEPGFGTEWQSWCATAALALTAAALRALAALAKAKGE